MTIVNKNKNIKYLGYLSDEKLIELYSRAKVFALPSLFEGIGLVALEAAAMGCDVVLTNRGAPKEYYNGMAFLVDPLDVGDIGSTIVDVMSGNTCQPVLSNYINSNYSINDIANNLADSYLNLI